LSSSPATSDLNVPPVVAGNIETLSKPPRRGLRHVGETLALVVLFAFSLEAACRIEDWVEFRTPLFARERSQTDLLVRDADGMHGRAGGRFEKWSLNSFGMRGPNIARAKSAHTIRVVTVGASETFGLYESPGREYPRQLEDSLNARLRDNTRGCPQWHAQVLNAAMPGMSLPTIDQDIRLRVRRLNPDLVVLYATPPSYLENAVPVAARPDSVNRDPPRLPKYYAFFPRVAARIRTQLKTFLPTALQDRIRRHEISVMVSRHPQNWRFDSVPPERVRVFEADLRHVVGTIRSVGAVPVLMTHANRFVGSVVREPAMLRAWEKFYPRATGQTIVSFDSVARLTTIRVARDSQAVLVDVQPALARSGRRSPFADFSHFTDVGAAIVADRVSGSILVASIDRFTEACQQGSISHPIQGEPSARLAP
jgi:hypothetical protein